MKYLPIIYCKLTLIGLFSVVNQQSYPYSWNASLAISLSGPGSKKLMKIEKATRENALLGQQRVLMFKEKEEWQRHCLLLLFTLLRTRLEALWWWKRL
jgi:hypothetical protein